MTGLSGIMTGGLVLPALVLGGTGWVVPRLLARVFPEGVGPLIWLTAASAAVMTGLSTGFFALLYLWQGVPIAVLAEAGAGAGLSHFLRLGLMSGLLWVPVLVLSAAGLPKHWKEAVW